MTRLSRKTVLAAKTNELQQRVVEEQLDRRISAWKKMDEKDVSVDFPSLSEEELRELTVGVYQLKLARSYTTEHLNKDGDYEIMLNEDVADILRVKVQSRHTSSKKYMLWIEYSPEIVKHWYCQCRAGTRVVGACAHIASVLWYLGYARHLGTVREVKNWSDYLEDASKVPELVDEDSEESGTEE